ncbi:MAG: hemolysin family protein [Rhizobiaceae bacterium]|jgi:CBS domain containing-hemolysin-like protein|nr:hemolysin family protein [Rhizobiaceae bacterium]
MPDTAETDTSAEPVPKGQALVVAPSPQRPQTRSLLDRVLEFFRGKPSDIRVELTDALSEETPAQPGGLSPAERAMLNNILRLNEVRVSDVMVPRGEIESVEMSQTLGELLDAFERSGHSRMPVYHETMDDPRGMIHIRDVLTHVTRASRKKTRAKAPAETAGIDLKLVDLTQTIAQTKLWRPVLFVPASMPAADLMAQMQAKRIQMALVIDEYGGTDGLVSLEDIVEMIVGDIEDEHDDDEPLIEKRPDGSFIMDARAFIDDVTEVIGDGFSIGEHAEDVDTIGGVAVSALGRLPLKGEIIAVVPGFEIEVLDADTRRVKRLRIRTVRAAEPRRRVKGAKGDQPSDSAGTPAPRNEAA